jgi:hypothetical protein
LDLKSPASSRSALSSFSKKLRTHPNGHYSARCVYTPNSLPAYLDLQPKVLQSTKNPYQHPVYGWIVWRVIHGRHGPNNYIDTKPYMSSLLVFNKVYRLETCLYFRPPSPLTFLLVHLPPPPFSLCEQVHGMYLYSV